MMVCPNCNYNLESEHNFCPSCGFDLREQKLQINDNTDVQIPDGQTKENQILEFVVCDICGEETPEGSGYCESCGARLTGKEQKISRNVEVSDPEIKQESVEKLDKKEKSVKLDNALSDKEDVVKKGPEKKRDKNTTISGQKQVKTRNIPVAKKAELHRTGRNLNQKSIKPLYIGIFVFALVAIGFVVLYLTGIFDAHTDARQNNISENNASQQQGSRINLEELQRINDLENSVKKDTTNLGSVLELAHLLNDSGLKERAIPYYNMYLRGNPRSVDVLVDLGVCYFELGQFDKAKKEMKKGWNINPRHQIANFNLGIVNFSAGNLDSAKIWWRKAIEIDPNSEIGKKSKELLDSH